MKTGIQRRIGKGSEKCRRFEREIFIGYGAGDE
jgi:hypothetical protein